jgi:protein-S-isoprenylcysteine O-methyltransferase Ste14
MSYLVLAFGAIVFPVLFFIPAPYGRHTRKGWGPSIPAKLGWVLMEAPSFFTFAAAWVLNPAWQTPVVFALGVAYLLHYGQRTFVYTARMRADGKLKPVLTVVMAMAFNVLNGWGNGSQLTERSIDVAFVVGLALFVAGFLLNLHSDAVLRSLRAPGEGGYKVPHGGLHRFVASPNYFGEIVEWLGFAIAAQTLAGWAFFFFTCANLVPRARSHWQWYRKEFSDYPAERRALIPFVW